MLALKKWLISLFGNIKPRYLPLLLIYFAYGISGFTGIAETFWVKEHLDLSAEALIAISFWVLIPWTIKIIFGQFADSVRIFGSQRKIYIFIGAGLIILGQLILIGLAVNSSWLLQFGSSGKLYLLSAVIGTVGFVLQDVIADTMSTEVVDRTDNITGTLRETETIKKDLAHVQWLGRMMVLGGGFLVAGIGGWLAEILSYQTIFTLAIFIPIVSITGAIFVRLDNVQLSPVNWHVMGGGLLYVAFIIGVELADVQYGQEIVFLLSLGILSFLMWRVGITKTLFFTAIAVFLFRAMPGTGPGISWWMIDVLNFDKAFMGTLAQLGAFVSLLALFLLRIPITKKPIRFTLIWLTVIGAFMSLPSIGLYYGIHERLGIDARTVALFDTAVSSPLGQLSMIPLLTIIAYSCPKGHAGTWFALMTSLMNVAISAGTLGTKYLNQIYVVTREIRDASGMLITPANYENVGALLIITTVIGLVVPLFAILIFLKDNSVKTKLHKIQ